MVPTIRPARTWIVCGPVGWVASGHSPSVSSHSASRGWSGSCVESHYGGSTSASSAFSPWRASRWIRGCSRTLASWQVRFEKNNTCQFFLAREIRADTDYSDARNPSAGTWNHRGHQADVIGLAVEVGGHR